MLRFFKVFSLFFLILFGFFIIHSFEPTQDKIADITYYLRENPLGIPLYILLCSVLVCFLVPRQILAFAGGYAFNAFYGTLFSSIGVIIGCALAFYYARFIAQSFVQRRFHKYVSKMDIFFQKNTFLMAIIIRLLPIGSNLLTNMLAGVTRIKAFPFFAGSFLGYIPQNLIFALLGSGFQLEARSQMLVSGALLLLSVLVGYLLYKKYVKDDTLFIQK